MSADPLMFEALRKQLLARRIAVSNLTNLARTIFKDGVTVKYSAVNSENMIVEQVGTVNGVEREGWNVLVVVVPYKSKKPRRVSIEHVNGVM